jgi:CheY-like chemotaxis protein
METPTCTAILVVEDDDEIRELVVERLRSEGFHVYEARNGKKGRALIPGMPRPLLILADWITPSMRSDSFVDVLQVGDRIAALPVVVVTSADPSAPDGRRQTKKPIDLNDYIELVARLCVRRI